MATLKEDWFAAWRDLVDPNLPDTPANRWEPPKADIRDVGTKVYDEIELLKSGQLAGSVVYATYAELEERTDLPVGSKGTVTDDTGRHVDPVSPAISTVTITIATPAVISWTAHGLVAGAAVKFTTTGALPTGITASTTYYVIEAGLTADAFEIGATPGGAAINTSGSQSGTHTATEFVSNTGIYSWSASPAGWERVADYDFAILSAAIATETTDRTDEDTALGVRIDNNSLHLMLTVTGTADAYTGTVSPALPDPLTDGLQLLWIPHLPNNDSATLLDVPLTLADGTAIPASTFPAMEPVISTYLSGNWINWKSGDMEPTTYTFDASMTAGTSADVLIAAPASGVIYDLDLQVASEAGLVAIRDDGMLPSLHTKGSWTYQAGVEVSGKRKLLSGPIRIIADREGVDVTARFRTTFNDNPNAEAAALAHLDRYTGSLDVDQEAAVKAFYKSIYNAGVFQLGGWLSVLIAPNAADALMDWMSVDGDPLTTSGSPTFTAFDGYDFNGSSQYLDSGQLLGSIGAIDDHTLLVDTGTTIQAANACAIGDGTTRIQPNRSTTSARFNSGSATGDVVTGFTVGGLVGLTRRSTAIYEVFHNESFTDNVTRTPGSLSTSLNVLVGAGNSSGGVNNFFAGDIRLAAVLTQMTRAQEITFATAWATFKTAMGI